MISLLTGKVAEIAAGLLLLALLGLGVSHWRQGVDLGKAQKMLTECQAAGDRAARTHADERTAWADASRASESEQRTKEQALMASYEKAVEDGKQIENSLRGDLVRSTAAADSLRQQAVAAARALATRASAGGETATTASVGDDGPQADMVPAFVYDRVDGQRRDLAAALDRTYEAKLGCERAYEVARSR